MVIIGGLFGYCYNCLKLNIRKIIESGNTGQFRIENMPGMQGVLVQ
jgi:hypothetical protein